jgi:hypothetical protein
MNKKIFYLLIFAICFCYIQAASLKPNRFSVLNLYNNKNAINFATLQDKYSYFLALSNLAQNNPDYQNYFGKLNEIQKKEYRNFLTSQRNIKIIDKAADAKVKQTTTWNRIKDHVSAIKGNREALTKLTTMDKLSKIIKKLQKSGEYKFSQADLRNLIRYLKISEDEFWFLLRSEPFFRKSIGVSLVNKLSADMIVKWIKATENFKQLFNAINDNEIKIEIFRNLIPNSSSYYLKLLVNMDGNSPLLKLKLYLELIQYPEKFLKVANTVKIKDIKSLLLEMVKNNLIDNRDGNQLVKFFLKKMGIAFNDNIISQLKGLPNDQKTLAGIKDLVDPVNGTLPRISELPVNTKINYGDDGVGNQVVEQDFE